MTGAFPTAAEDLLVIGLLAALAERIGTAELRVHPAALPEWSYAQGAWPQEGRDIADSSRWCLSWGPDIRQPAASSHEEDDWPQAAYRLLAADPAQGWTLNALARSLGTSSRSLQRRLHSTGHSFSSLWIEARLARSAERLAASRESPAEVGYVCGFSDQAHFTRLFKLHTAMTPALYRKEFSAM